VGANGHVVIEESPTMTDDVDFTEVRQQTPPFLHDFHTCWPSARPEWVVKRREGYNLRVEQGPRRVFRGSFSFVCVGGLRC
jgi:hypothetical protein